MHSGGAGGSEMTTAKDTKYHEDCSGARFPSCYFVPFVV
jgi:hypothetical protein